MAGNGSVGCQDSNSVRAMPLCRMIDKECANGEFRVVRNRDCDRPCVGSTLHHHMTTASPDLAEAVFFKNSAGISTGKNSQFTHAPLRSVL